MKRIKKLFRSFEHAFTGFIFIFRREQNIRIELIAAFFVVGTMIVVGVQIWEAVVLVIMIAVVLILEVINTALEQLINMLKPRVHPKAKILKDLMATAVFLASVASATIGFLIFWPYIIS